MLIRLHTRWLFFLILLDQLLKKITHSLNSERQSISGLYVIASFKVF